MVTLLVVGITNPGERDNGMASLGAVEQRGVRKAHSAKVCW